MYVRNAPGLHEQHYLYASGSLIWLVPYWHNNLVTSSNTTPAENEQSNKQHSENTRVWYITVREKDLNPEPLPDKKKTCVTKQYLVVSELQLFNKNTFNQFAQKE